MSRIYLDNNATTVLDPRVRSHMLECYEKVSGNPSSLHREGRNARGIIDSARESIAEMLGAIPENVLFTSGASEANNLALKGFHHAVKETASSDLEHPSARDCMRQLGCSNWMNVDSSGTVQLESLSPPRAEHARLICLMLVNNESGVVQPVQECVAQCGGMDIVHCDGVQAIGRIEVSFEDLGVDSLSLSAHKFHGPAGIGALITRRRSLLQPLTHGGHQEFGIRPGTESVALISGMALAIQLAIEGQSEYVKRVTILRNELEERLVEELEGISIHGQSAARVANTSNVCLAGINAQSAVMALDLAGVSCATGSACASGAMEPSPALVASGMTESQARSCIRFSLSRNTTREEVLDAAGRVCQIVISHRKQAT